MKNKIFMYLFFFAILFVIFQYMNEKKIYENQENEIKTLTEKLEKANDSILTLGNMVADLNYFTLQGNENAMTYLENSGFESKEVEVMVADVVYEYNTVKGNNPLVPFEGLKGDMKINKIRFLNHKWLLADFTDGTYWGEMILEFTFNNENQMELNTIASLLYPNY